MSVPLPNTGHTSGASGMVPLPSEVVTPTNRQPDDVDHSSVHKVAGYSLRKRKKYLSLSSLSSSTPERGTNSFRVEDEARAWDAFYSEGRDSDAPFSGFDTTVTVKILSSSLKRIRSAPLIDTRDIILEVGHGKHPLLWDIERTFGHFGFYSGIEFSGNSIFEAIKLRQRMLSKDGGHLGDNVEFLRATSVDYFNPDGSCTAEVILPTGCTRSKLSAGTVTLVLAKSTLDYVTCRLTGSVDTLDWDRQPRISPSVVTMFDSFSIALGASDKDRPKALVFVEPGDFIKFRDHIATIARVIYSATFCDNSPARYFRLTHVQRHKDHKAVCYTLQKTSKVYNNYQDLRDDIYKVTSRLYDLSESQDDDWLLPLTVPPRWNSSTDEDLEPLLAI